MEETKGKKKAMLYSTDKINTNFRSLLKANTFIQQKFEQSKFANLVKAEKKENQMTKER